MQQNHYDYIIAGAGCSGLSLAMHIIHEKSLQHKRILLVDQHPKNTNDRTWCFWEKGTGFFEPVVCKDWSHLQFHSTGFSKQLSIAPYRYKMIRGLDFYNYCLQSLRAHPTIEFIQGSVERVFSDKKTGVVINGQTFTSEFVFNSIQPEKPRLKKKDIWLLQHFKGWMIETPQPAFDQNKATLMDFRVSQHRGTSFCYVLPLSPTKALVEYTLFTASLLSPEEYDEELKSYIRQRMELQHFSVTETETGVIPMTNYRFLPGNKNVINLGTAGGQTKGSSGYTFYFIQHHSQKIVQQLVKGEHPQVKNSSARFHFYDSVLLEVLSRNSIQGHEIFSILFKKNKPQDVLAFLNNASSLSTEIKIISTLPTLPFLKAALRQVT